MMRNLVTLDYDGYPHDAGTAAPAYGADLDRSTHWIDEMPATSLDGIKLVFGPGTMVMANDGRWMRRDEYEALVARAA